MAINIQLRDGLIEVTYRGNITAEDLQQHLQDLEDLESRLEVTPDRIADLMDATVSEMHSDNMVTFAKSRHHAKLKNRIKSAVIARGPLQYGFARMFMTYNQNPDIEIRIFRDSASAYGWFGREETNNKKPNA